MIDHGLPQSWKAPPWHADFGDVQGELEHLRCLAKAILSRNNQLVVELQCPEPGLMFLVVSRAGQPLAEVYSILESKDRGERQYGLFLFPGGPQEQEEYAESVEHATDLLLDRLTETLVSH